MKTAKPKLEWDYSYGRMKSKAIIGVIEAVFVIKKNEAGFEELHIYYGEQTITKQFINRKGAREWAGLWFEIKTNEEYYEIK